MEKDLVLQIQAPLPVVLNMLNDIAWQLISQYKDEALVAEVMPHIEAIRKTVLHWNG